MNANNQRTFYYHADANAFGGIVRKPVPRSLSSRASVSLAQAGGMQSARAAHTNVEGILSFEEAAATVSGSGHQDDGGWRCIATASIERLRILNTVTADRLVAQISVMHFADNRPPQISFHGTQFVNLRVNGQQIEPELDWRLFTQDGDRDHKEDPGPWCSQPARFGDLLNVARRQYAEGNAALRELGSRFAMSDPDDELKRKGSALCTLVRGVTPKARMCVAGHVVHLPDFGNIMLGEMRVTPNSAQLTMLRVEMGCMADGEVSAGTVFSNGSLMP